MNVVYIYIRIYITSRSCNAIVRIYFIVIPSKMYIYTTDTCLYSRTFAISLEYLCSWWSPIHGMLC